MPLPPPPGFLAHRSAHYVFHVRPGSVAQHTEGSWHALPNAGQARRLLDHGEYVPPSRLAADDVFWAQSADVAYPIAGAFVSFLVAYLVMEGFPQRYYTQEKPDMAGLDDDFRRWLGA